jgi:alkylation response protein AidB-like acyl-CoA dehydrogenase
MTTTALLDIVQKIEPVLRENAGLAEQACRLQDASVQAMRDAGLCAMWVPEALGGLELDPVSTFSVLEEVARIDAAAGWNLQLTVGFAVFGAWLPDEGAREIFSRDVVVAGALFPPARAVRAEGGYRITGRMPFVSGCHHADWIIAPATVMDEAASRTRSDEAPVSLIVFLPGSDIEIIDHWDTLGLRGTGSHDIAFAEAFIPERRTAPFVPFEDRPPGSAYQGPLYRLVFWQAVAALATPALGIARAAIDDVVSLATTKTPAYTGIPLRERVVVQSQIAQAEAHLGAAKAYLHDAVGEAWNSCQQGSILSTKHREKLQLASSHAAQEAAVAVRLVHTAAGTSGIRNEFPFARHFRNIHSVTQHAFISPSRFESVGQLMFGLQPEWPFFAF